MGNFLVTTNLSIHWFCKLLKSAGPLNLQSGRAAHESNCPTFFFPSLLHLSPFAVPFGPVAIAAGCPATRPLVPVLTSQVDERLLRSATNLKSCGLCHFHRCLRSHRCCHNYHHSHRHGYHHSHHGYFHSRRRHHLHCRSGHHRHSCIHHRCHRSCSDHCLRNLKQQHLPMLLQVLWPRLQFPLKQKKQQVVPTQHCHALAEVEDS